MKIDVGKIIIIIIIIIRAMSSNTPLTHKVHILTHHHFNPKTVQVSICNKHFSKKNYKEMFMSILNRVFYCPFANNNRLLQVLGIV